MAAWKQPGWAVERLALACRAGALPARVRPGYSERRTPRFMNVPIGDGKIGIEEPLSKAGDFVDLRAETDLLVAISNCPQERNPCNAYTPTRLRVVAFGPPPA
jgi:uncharacterized protein YcgI (DUF1989 family)